MKQECRGDAIDFPSREIPSDVEGVSKMYICTVPGCPRADMKWRQKTNIFLHHSEVHATPDQLKFSCSFCHKEFISQTILNLHIHSIHKRERERASKPGTTSLVNEKNPYQVLKNIGKQVLRRRSPGT